MKIAVAVASLLEVGAGSSRFLFSILSLAVKKLTAIHDYRCTA
jgi:hypothetical protein